MQIVCTPLFFSFCSSIRLLLVWHQCELELGEGEERLRSSPTPAGPDSLNLSTLFPPLFLFFVRESSVGAFYFLFSPLGESESSELGFVTFARPKHLQTTGENGSGGKGISTVISPCLPTTTIQV